MVMKWLMQNAMHEMINDKCRNDTSITMPWRDAYAMLDMNAFIDTRARKIISSYLHIRGHSAPCVQLRRWYGPSSFPWQKTRPTYNACMTTWCRCALIFGVKMWDKFILFSIYILHCLVVWRICIMSSRRHCMLVSSFVTGTRKVHITFLTTHMGHNALECASKKRWFSGLSCP